MLKIWIYCAVLSLLISAPSAAADVIIPGEPVSGRDIMERLDRADTSKDSRRIMTMVIQRPGGERVRRMLSFQRNLSGWSQSLIILEKPDDVRDTAFLSWAYDDIDREDDMWMYLPASGLLRRITGSGRKGAFMGSDLANEDIKDRAVDDDKHVYKGWVKCGEHLCVSVESRPHDQRKSMYSKRISHIRTDIWQVVYIEYYDLAGHLLKTSHIGGFVEHDDIWSATKMVVETPRSKSRTLIKFSDIQYNVGLSEEMFNPQSIKR